MESINLLCVGLGGCGQTYFMKYLNNYNFKLNCLKDTDGKKHLCCPSKLPEFKNNIKIIYIYNKTFNSICSHFRRRWASKQIKKLNIKKVKSRYNNINNYYSLVEKNKQDLFGCKNHFLRWYNYKHKYPIYFLNLNDINKNELSKFLDCDVKIFDNLNINNTDEKYTNIILNYPISYKFYKIMDDCIDKLSKEYNNLNKLP